MGIPPKVAALTAAAVLSMLAGSSMVCHAQTLGWEPNTARGLVYSVTVEHGLKNGRPEFVERFTMALSFLGDGRVEITREGRAPVTFQTTSGGNLRVTRSGDTPPYAAILLLNSMPAVPTKLDPQATWETRFPTDADANVEADKLGTQDRLLGRVSGAQGDTTRIEVEGQARALRNQGSTLALGGDLPKFENLFGWNFFLTGNLEFAAAAKQVRRAEFSYVLLPIPGLTREQLVKQEAFQHAVLVAQN